MSKSDLGKRLDVQFGDAVNETSSNDFEYLPLQRIEPKQDKPRTLFEEERISELADSISEHGVLSPIIVRSVEGGCYQIIAGENRWRAARKVGLKEVPVRIVDADAEFALIESLQREALNPIDEARGYRILMEKFDMTQEEIAQRVSKSLPAIANSLRLLSLPDELIELVHRKELSVDSARAMLDLKTEEQLKEEKKNRSRV